MGECYGDREISGYCSPSCHYVSFTLFFFAGYPHYLKVSGTGLMCKLNVFRSCLQADRSFSDINNVGSISQALFAKDNPAYDEKTAVRWQATQVSTFSIANCLGRILIGIVCRSHLDLLT
jgi:hypothetical protein